MRFVFSANQKVRLDSEYAQSDGKSVSRSLGPSQKSRFWVLTRRSTASGNENVKLINYLFEVKKSGVFLFGISFFGLEIFTILYYANEESDDVINRST